MASIFDSELRILDAETDGPFIIATGDNSDLAEIFHRDTATVSISRDEALKAARLFCNATDLAMCLEALVDAVCSDSDFRQQCCGQLEQAQKVLSRAYGASA